MVDKDDQSDSSSQPADTPWILAHSLREGDTVRINDRYNDLTVTSVDTTTNNGATTEITLTGNDTTYTLRVSNHAPSDPLLTYPSASQSEPVTSIEATGDTILSNVQASDIITGELTPAYSIDTVPEFTSHSLEQLGTCPECDHAVVKQNERAVCTNCGAWAYMPEWNAYHNDT